jgi:peptide/nickel transport system substrate-binding protein
MCSGPFTLKSFKAGGDVVITRNDRYWNDAARARTSQITFKGVPSDANLSAAFSTGDVDGAYRPILPTYNQLQRNDKLALQSGPSLTTDAIVISSLDGPMGDVRTRRALSLAIDRVSYIRSVYADQALLPRTSTNPGTWAYARDVFARTSGREPEMKQDLAEARRLADAAGLAGRTLMIGTSSAIPSVSTQANVVAQAARALGMVPKLKPFGIYEYGSLFIDPKAREGLDVFATLNNPNYADPAPYLASYVTPGGGQNFSGYRNPEAARLLERARATADDDARAELAARADELVTEGLPWIPVAQPYSVVIQNDRITGAPASSVFMSAPWASMIGKAGQ